MWLNQFVVLDKIGKTLLVAISNVLGTEVFDKLEKVSGSQIFVYISTASQIHQALEKNVPINGSSRTPRRCRSPAPPRPERRFRRRSSRGSKEWRSRTSSTSASARCL